MDKIPCEPPLLYTEQSHPDLSAFPWITSAPVLWPPMWPFAGFGLVCWCQFLPSPIPTGELHSEHGTPHVSNLMRFSLTNFFSMSRYLWMAALWSHESTCPASLSSANFEGAFCPVIQVINGGFRQYWCKCWPLRLQHQWLASIGISCTGHNCVSQAVQPGFNLHHCHFT